MHHNIDPPCVALPPARAAAAVGISRTRIFHEIKVGNLKAHKIGKTTLIDMDELRRWVRCLPVRGPGEAA